MPEEAGVGGLVRSSSMGVVGASQEDLLVAVKILNQAPAGWENLRVLERWGRGR